MSAVETIPAIEAASVPETITATEFKAKCLDILDRLASHEIEKLVITKRGKPVAVLTPPEKKPFKFSMIYGSQRGTVHLPDDLDLTQPIFDEVFDAELGILHR
jgi:prevent-host-death family protein